MGTSVNQRSPRTGPWDAVAAAYRNGSIPLDRTLQLVWRAALREPGCNVKELLISDGVMTCLEAALHYRTPAEALTGARAQLAERKSMSFIASIARRAAALSCQADDPAAAFAANLFVQMTDYFVSRDLPSYVGAPYRNKGVSDAMEFKDRLRGMTCELLMPIATSPTLRATEAWEAYVSTALKLLARTRL